LTFEDLNFDPDLMQGLKAMGFKSPTPIQEQAIPEILAGNDLIACAQTGTGKTAAFVLPVLHRILQEENRQLNTLILAPTRELALQIDQQIDALSYFTGASSIPIYGGGDGVTWEQQKRALENGVEIVVATPGRLIALLQSGSYDWSNLKHLILDEADRMLDMGFYDDIVRIVSEIPKARQTLLFSATMPPRIRALAGKIMRPQPKEVSISISKPAEGILQQAYLAHDHQKERLLRRILRNPEYQSILIFVSTKEKVRKLDFALHKAGFPVKAFHSDLEQAEREQIMREFKNKKLRILVGTDVLSRGIDVEGISLVINYDSPSDPEDYVHRVGRTARAATTGTAITFINEKDMFNFGRIEALIGKEIPKIPLPPEMGEGPVYAPKTRPPFEGRGGGGGRSGGRKGSNRTQDKRGPRQ
jgi:ATP-dependent RNA helicase RhlE